MRRRVFPRGPPGRPLDDPQTDTARIPPPVRRRPEHGTGLGRVSPGRPSPMAWRGCRQPPGRTGTGPGRPAARGTARAGRPQAVGWLGRRPAPGADQVSPIRGNALVGALRGAPSSRVRLLGCGRAVGAGFARSRSRSGKGARAPSVPMTGRLLGSTALTFPVRRTSVRGRGSWATLWPESRAGGGARRRTLAGADPEIRQAR